MNTSAWTSWPSCSPIDRLREICSLTGDGLNLAGIRRVLELQEQTRQLHTELARLQDLAARRGKH